MANIVKNRMLRNHAQQSTKRASRTDAQIHLSLFRLRSRRSKISRRIQKLKKAEKQVPSHLRSMRSKISWKIRKAKTANKIRR